MSTTKKKAKDKFKFVNYTNPKDARESKVRTQVRSQASRWQHSQSRARLHNAALALDHNKDASADDTVELTSYRSSSNDSVDVAGPSSSSDLAERRETFYAQHDDGDRHDNKIKQVASARRRCRSAYNLHREDP